MKKKNSEFNTHPKEAPKVLSLRAGLSKRSAPEDEKM
jgi:hypothetical protein